MKEKQQAAEKPIVFMNFSGIYREQTFYQEEICQWIDGTDLSGTNGYCDAQAKNQIRKKMSAFPVSGIHFLDGGNYHYLSSFWTEKIKQPFVLVVFDWHTDMQKSAFGEILSCGSWVRNVIEEQTFLKKVCLIGVNPLYYKEVENDYPDRVLYISTEKLKQIPETVVWEQLGADKLPVYLSVDKDVLSEDEVQTDWDQGNMSLELLKKWLLFFVEKTKLLGIDICGECTNQEIDKAVAIAKNEQVNKELLKLFT